MIYKMIYITISMMIGFLIGVGLLKILIKKSKENENAT